MRLLTLLLFVLPAIVTAHTMLGEDRRDVAAKIDSLAGLTRGGGEKDSADPDDTPRVKHGFHVVGDTAI
ncbi:MAG: hypothetical protein FJ303_15910 [Planctomycetes bacterium]|nr:hypothetical protein [Planctomycetota bacterium]